MARRRSKKGGAAAARAKADLRRRRAALKVERKRWRTDIPDEELLEDLRRVAQGLEKSYITEADYLGCGSFTFQTYVNRFGSWKNATGLAGLGPAPSRMTDENDLFYNILAVWLKLGRRPGCGELRRPLSKFSVHPYLARFGTWLKAMAAFFKWLRRDDPNDEDGSEAEYPPGTVIIRPADRDLPARRSSHKTQRRPGMRQRFRVMLRDNFRCRLCGRSPATHTGLCLRIDHIVPWSKGGETTDDNLQTLCSDCNYGKFDHHPPPRKRDRRSGAN
jgi:5-methylcytosine-specific restriction endonuclease McrA